MRLLLLLTVACAGPTTTQPTPTPSPVVAPPPDAPTPTSGVVADFQLTDVNPHSPTVGEPVSPRDYLQKVSGWYVTHAT